MKVDVWEPWQPQRGARVRVRLSGECQRRLDSEDETGGLFHGDGYLQREECAELREAGHPSSENGLTGRVVGIHGENVYVQTNLHRDWLRFVPVPERLSGHYYFVEFDDAPRLGGSELRLWYDSFAAIELEPATS